MQRFSQKKGLVCFLVLAFILLINAEFITARVSNDTEIHGEGVFRTEGTGGLASSTQQDRFESALNEGKRLMQEEFDYEGAIQKFNEALTHAVSVQQKSEVYFFLSLAYYATLDARGRQPFENTVRKLIEVDYHRTLNKEICPPRYIEWYQEIKKEYGAVQILSKPDGAVVYLSDRTEPLGKTPLIVGIKAGETKIALQMGDEKKEDTITVVAGAETLSPLYGFEIFVVPEEKPEEKPPEVAVEEGVKKKGGKSMLFILGGLVVAGGVAAAVLLGGGGSEEDSISTGSIQVNSNPTGADVYLDGQNTGQTTNTTLTGVSPGSHNVAVLKNGYGDYETAVSVTAGQTATVNATLAAHTIEVTRPTGSTSWTQGENVTIRWTTGGGVSQAGFMRASGSIGSAAGIIRMSRMRAARSNSAARDLRKRTTRRGDSPASERSDSQARGISAIDKTAADAERRSGQGTLNTPRNTSLSRINLLGSSQGASSNNTVKPQTLNRVRIELLRGGSLEETIVADTDNSGRYDWRVSSSIPDATNYKIRVSAAGDSSVRGDSDRFTIARLGELRVTSNPTGATIWVDGVSKGKTNKTIELPADEYKLKLTLDRYQDWDKGITIRANERTTVNATLNPGSFEENFSRGNAEYWKGDPYATWKVENGVYKVMEGGSYRHTSYYDLGKFENNWTYEVEANRAVGEHGRAHGPAFGGTDDFKTYYYFDIDSGDQYWSVWRISNNVPSVVRNWAKSTAIKQEGWNKFKIEAKGKSFTFYANGKNLGSINISSVPNKGKIGLVAWTGSDVSQVWFDNISFELSNSPLTISGSLGPMVTPIPVDEPDADSGIKKIK
jgi:hypothetical protein